MRFVWWWGGGGGGDDGIVNRGYREEEFFVGL